MTDRKKVLIGDDTVDYGITTASALRSFGLYAITRRKDGNILLNAILPGRRTDLEHNDKLSGSLGKY